MSHAVSLPSTENSYFDGNFWQRLGRIIVSRFLTVITLGLAYPAAVCMLLRWECKHTVINGRRLKFTGKGAQLFGKYILWWLLTIVTFGIFGIWLGLNMKKWTVKHTVYADDDTGAVSRFTGGVGGYIGIRLLAGLLTVCTFGIGSAWAKRMTLNWDTKHTYISGTQLGFTGRGGQLFGKYLLWGLLTVVTFSIFALFIPIKFLKWQYKHTGATPVEEVPGEKKAGVGVIIAVVGGGLAVLLVMILLFFPRASIALPDSSQDLPTNQVMHVLNDAGMLTPTLADAQQLPGNFESCVSYAEIEGEAFSFTLDSSLIPDERQDESWIQTYFTASGKISSTAYWDMEQDILYLDYGVESANCTTYLSLDGSQTGTGHAQPLTQIVSGGKGIHSVYYPYDTAPEYVYVMAFAHIVDTSVSDTGETDVGTYYFVTLHKQPLTVIVGTPDDLELTDPEDVFIEPDNANSSSDLVGVWVILGSPEENTVSDTLYAAFANGGWYEFRADGTFSLETRCIAYESGGWFDMGGGEKLYEGTYQQEGNIVTLHYTTTYKYAWDETIQNVVSQPVAMDEIEQFNIQPGLDDLTNVTGEHPRFGQLCLFQRLAEVEVPINVLLGHLAFEH